MQSRITPTALAVLLASTTAQAEVQFNGFLSVGAGILDTDEAQYLDYTDDVGFESDSVFGLQVNAPLADGFSITGQFVARGPEEYEAEIEWAFVAYEFSEHWTGRAGRLRAPFFMYSDSLEVGFTYPWVRPPTEVYRISFSAMDGVDITYSGQMGSWDSSVQAYYGAYHKDDLLGIGRGLSDIDLTNLMGIVGTVEKDAFLLRASYHQADFDSVSAGSTALLGALRGLPAALPAPVRAAGNAVADDLEIVDIGAQFYEIGVKYDPGDFFLIGEWTGLEFDRSLAQDTEGWFVSGGVRFGGKSTVYVSYADLSTDLKSGYSDPLKPFLPATAALVAVVDRTIAGGEADQSSWTLGYRYDLSDSVDVKFEYQSFDVMTSPTGSPSGQFHDVVPGWDGDAGLFTVALDAVF